jgi:multicomponent Na+:H+ antiporter subunit A
MPGVLVALPLFVLLAAAVAVPYLARRRGRSTGYVLAAVFGAALVPLLIPAASILRGERLVFSVPWVPGLDVRLTLVLDGLSLFFSLVVLGIGAVVMAYSARYFEPSESHARTYTLLTLFAAAMLGLVLAGDIIVLFVFWELTSVLSFLLIGGSGQGDAKAAATRALLVTSLGGLALFAGLVLMGLAAGTTDLALILSDPERVSGSAAGPALLALLLLGAFTKSAQFPFHFWLPGAMVAPTPVSTYLHAATMVKAGIYLVARMEPLFGVSDGPWREIIVIVGLVTSLVGAFLALKQHDLKELLAYSTVSQLGFLMALAGVGTFMALAAMAVHLLAHALYKSTLFMAVGIIDREAGSRDIRQLTGLRKAMPLTAAVTALAAMSMAGLPPLLGFVSKEESFIAFLDAPAPAWLAPLAGGMAAASASLTFAYGLRIFDGAFEGPLTQKLYEPRRSFLAPAALTALLGLALGLLVGQLDGLVSAAAATATGVAGHVHLALWHGFTPALALAASMMGLGFVLFLLRDPIDLLMDRIALPSGARVFDDLYAWTIRAGAHAAAPFMSTSPAVHMAWVLATLLVAGSAAWIVLRPSLPPLIATGVPVADVVVTALIVAAAAAAALARARVAAVAVLGIVGFLMAVVYALLGGPDLAITQLLVEALTVALVVLAFRRLSPAFPKVLPSRRIAALLLSLLVGGAGAAATFAFAGRRELSDAGAYFLRAGPLEAGGQNVVNTILVDFRALDTLGEITVLAVAALGILALVPLRDPPRRGRTLILLEAARVLTPGIIALSLYYLLRGHNAPGGGFIAALVAGSALILQFLTGGAAGGRRLLPVAPQRVLGAGLLLAVVYGLAGMLVLGEFLQGAVWEIGLPLVSTKFVTSLVFDLAVFVVVAAAFGAYLFSFWGKEP